MSIFTLRHPLGGFPLKGFALTRNRFAQSAIPLKKYCETHSQSGRDSLCITKDNPKQSGALRYAHRRAPERFSVLQGKLPSKAGEYFCFAKMNSLAQWCSSRPLAKARGLWLTPKLPPKACCATFVFPTLQEAYFCSQEKPSKAAICATRIAAPQVKKFRRACTFRGRERPQWGSLQRQSFQASSFPETFSSSIQT